ncbi:rho-related BTB domain-containing protein 3 isoform X2 [Xenopus laevis]|uniref:Rho-related BTB domain-containing protein 3 isoform X2 n=1 Tax=Xenopus laevis TaxID=8355 RepID=A0A8J0VE00_XENLA|nr:rho-related BTB domain-containing protein 3 isoform X2 [Xenopus laevis]
MSVNILLLGNERDQFSDDNEHQSLASFYLHRRANRSLIQENQPGLKVYQADVFGNIQVVLHEFPSSDVLRVDLQTSQRVASEADIIIVKYSVNAKNSYLDVKDNFVPLIRQIFSHCTVPVIVAAVGSRINEGPPCSCPLCTSDRGICVTASEGIQLAKDLAATYMELHALNDFYVGSYFGGVLEYFIIQTLNTKTSAKSKKKKNNQFLKVKPPNLEQPEKMPVLQDDPSQYESDFQGLLVHGQCADVIFCTSSLEHLLEAHRIVLCSVSDVFMLLFGGKSAYEVHDSCVLKTTSNLFAVCRDVSVTAEYSPVRVIVKDSLLCSCLSDILHFIYSGAYQWHLLKQQLRKKIEDPEDVARVLHRVRCILKKPGKEADVSYYTEPWQFCSALGRFFNTPLLADVVFQVQDITIPAHRAVLVARCEVMAAMFSGSYAEAKSFLIPIYGISKDTFLCFLEYLYSDCCCPASILQAMSLLVCSEMYQVYRLQHLCEHYIISQLQSMPSRELATTSMSVVSLIRKAKFHNSEHLATWLLHFMALNYLIFSQKSDFQDLSEERDFVETHRWPSSIYLKQLAEYRQYIHSQKYRCSLM